MNSIDFMNKYGLTALIIGVISCIVCGLVKVPIVRRIRNNAATTNASPKIVADRIRNICNLIVAITVILALSIWYVSTEGIKILLTSKLYADMLTAFTCAKLIYMFYEGAGGVSFKKLAHAMLERIKNSKSVNRNDKVVDWIEIVQRYLVEDICLPLTEGQSEELVKLLKEKQPRKESKDLD